MQETIEQKDNQGQNKSCKQQTQQNREMYGGEKKTA